jgi:hypothetical protein
MIIMLLGHTSSDLRGWRNGSLRVCQSIAQVRFVKDEVAVFFSELLGFPLLITILSLLNSLLSPPYEVCDSPDQATHYHTLDPKLGSYL